MSICELFETEQCYLRAAKDASYSVMHIADFYLFRMKMANLKLRGFKP